MTFSTNPLLSLFFSYSAVDMAPSHSQLPTTRIEMGEFLFHEMEYASTSKQDASIHRNSPK